MDPKPDPDSDTAPAPGAGENPHAPARPYPHLLRAAEVAALEVSFCHPWDSRCELRGSWMGRRAGLKRTGVSLGRLAPGRHSFPVHLHQFEEEWIYVLSGRGLAMVDGEPVELAAGDFIAFPAPGPAHGLSNPGTEDLVYLMGGENRSEEIADFPELDRRMVRLGERYTIYKLSEGKPLE